MRVCPDVYSFTAQRASLHVYAQDLHQKQQKVRIMQLLYHK